MKHVEFYTKNKFEKLVHLVGFIIRIYHDARSPEHQIMNNNLKIHNTLPRFTFTEIVDKHYILLNSESNK